MLGWFLDPTAEHGFGQEFLSRFARLAAAAGEPALEQAVSKASSIKVHTEIPEFGGRYDILLCADETEFVVENKTKSIGAPSQLKRYRDRGKAVVALGLTEYSYATGIDKRFPLLTYADIHRILTDLEPADTDFGVLVRHYTKYLQDELWFFGTIKECFSARNLAGHTDLVEHAKEHSFNQNDERFANWFMLEHLRRTLDADLRWEGTQWNTEKNMQSGVWLADYERRSTSFKLSSELESFCRVQDAQVWLHVELWKGILAPDVEDEAGIIQLRCSTSADRQRARKAFLKIYVPEPHDHKARAPRASAGTFMLTGRKLKKRELSIPILQHTMAQFYERFGTFTSS